jgi:hypothetical protein
VLSYGWFINCDARSGGTITFDFTIFTFIDASVVVYIIIFYSCETPLRGWKGQRRKVRIKTEVEGK